MTVYLVYRNPEHTLAPGSFPLTGLRESKSASYLDLSVAVTAQLTAFGNIADVGDVIENEPTEATEGIADTFSFSIGGCSPCTYTKLPSVTALLLKITNHVRWICFL